MALTDDLLAWYALEEDFDQEIFAVNSVPPNANPLGPFLSTGQMRVRSVPGKTGKGAELRFDTGDGSSSALTHADDAMFRLASDKTFACWFKLSAFNAANLLFEKQAEYSVYVDPTTHKVTFSGVVHPTIIELDRWYFVVVWRVQSTGIGYISLNASAPTSGAVGAFPAAHEFTIGHNGAIDGVIDELAIYDRILTADERSSLYNEGNGLTYTAIIAAETPQPCRTLECCDDNPAAYVSATGEGKGYNSACEPLPTVIFEPPSGARIIMPSLVALRSDNPNAVIHYTTDGSTPDRNSAVYSTPLTVSGPADVIRALAIVEGCPVGPETAAQYQQFTPAAHFTYACTTTDKSGQWGAFAADGNADYNWQIQIQFAAITGVKEFTIEQLFPDGSFTGVLWSTKEYPLAEFPSNRAFPLVIWKGGVQQNVAYLNDYSGTVGNFGIGAHTLELYGSPWTSLPASHLFKLRMVFSDGTTLERLIDSTCDALPGALCPVPSITSLTPQCGPPLRIDIVYSLGIGTSRKIFRSTDSPSGPFVEIASGAVGASPETFQDNTVVAAHTYYYYIANIPAGCTAYVNSAVMAASPIPPSEVDITATAFVINAGDSTTIIWTSQNNFGTVLIDPTIGVQPGNVSGTQVVSPAVTTTYTIIGQNICGDGVAAQVIITVIPPASCALGAQPALVRIQGYHSHLFGSGGCNFRSGGTVPWNGMYANDPEGECSFVPAPALTGTGTPDYNFGSDIVPNREMNIAGTTIVQSAGLWILTVMGYDPGGANVVAWRGTKPSGDTPLGIYTRTTGCSPIPTSLTVEEV